MPITTAARSDLIALTIGMFNAAPGQAHLNDLVTAWNAGASLSVIANVLDDTTAFNMVFPPLQTSEEFAEQLADNLLGDEVAPADKAWVVNWLAGQINAGVSRGTVILTAVTALLTTTNTSFANAQLAFNNKIDVAEYYSVEAGLGTSTTSLLDLQTVISGVTSDPASVTAAMEDIDEAAAIASGQTYNLTAGIDTVNANKGNDIINAVSPNSLTDHTLTAFDNVDGGDGNDTINIIDLLNDLEIPASAKVVDVENAILSSTGAVTVDLSTWTGLENVTVAAADGAVDITTKGNATSVTVATGATTVDIEDAATTDTLTTVSITGNTGAATIASKALTDLSLASTSQNATVTAAAGTRVLDLSLNAVTGGIIADATATTLNVAATGAASSGVTLNAAAATTVNIDADVALTITDVNIAAATKITVTGDSKVTLNGATTITALTAIDASASTGGADVDAITLGNAILFTGGAGSDAVKLGASTKTTVMGAGDDLVTLTGAALGAGGTVDAGEGTDTLSMTAANADIASDTAVFEGKISGFERLTLTAPTTDTVDLANLDDISYVSTAGATALTLNNMASGGTLVLTGASTAATVAVANAAVSTSDVLNLKISNAAGVDVGTITAANVETINLNTDDTALAPAGIQHDAILTAANATTLTVTGDAGIDLVLTGSVALATINTSGVTKGAVSITTVADVATTFTGGATATTISLAGITTGTKAGTITTGAGNDTITGGAGADTINSGDGTNSISGADGNDIITGGAGVDTITGGLGADTITGGLGADIYTYTTALESNGVNQDTIIGFVSGSDKLAINTTGTGAAAVYLGEANGYGAVLTALSGAATANGGEAVLDITTGTLYVDIDVNGILDAADMAIQLTGVTDLASGDIIWS